jgi:amidase
MKLLGSLSTRDTETPAFEPFTFTLARRSAKRTPARLLDAEVALQGIAHQMGRFLEEYDVLLTSVLGSPPIELGTIDQTRPWDELVEMLFRYVAFTPIANFSGLPAMSVPLHWTEDGLPVGSQFMGRLGDEATLFALAGQLEAARPWADRKPPVYAG